MVLLFLWGFGFRFFCLWLFQTVFLFLLIGFFFAFCVWDGVMGIDVPNWRNDHMGNGKLRMGIGWMGRNWVPHTFMLLFLSLSFSSFYFLFFPPYFYFPTYVRAACVDDDCWITYNQVSWG